VHAKKDAHSPPQQVHIITHNHHISKAKLEATTAAKKVTTPTYTPTANPNLYMFKSCVSVKSP
jgi:hypothetical protein